MLTEDEQVEMVKRSLGLEPKRLYTALPSYQLYELISTASYSNGLLTATAMMLKKSSPEFANTLLTEVDRIRHKLSRELYDSCK